MNQTTGMSLEELLRQKPAPLPLMPENLKRVEEPEEEEIIEEKEQKNTQKQINNNESEEELSKNFFQKGVELLKNKSPFEALPNLYTAWTLDENCLKAGNNIVIALWQLKSTDLAMKTVEKVLNIDPENATALSHKKFLQSRMKG